MIIREIWIYMHLPFVECMNKYFASDISHISKMNRYSKFVFTSFSDLEFDAPNTYKNSMSVSFVYMYMYNFSFEIIF